MSKNITTMLLKDLNRQIGFYFCSLWILILILISHTAANDPVAERDLMNYLFEDYDVRARPVKSITSVIDVHLEYWLVTLIDIEEKTEIVSTFGWIGMGWTDELIQWDLNEYNISYIVVSAESVWLPDVAIRNSADQIYGDILDPEKYRVFIDYNGHATLYVAGRLDTFCNLDLTFFPFDLQSCYIHLSSWTYSEREVRFIDENSKINTELFHSNSQWTLSDTKVISVGEQIGNETFSGTKFVMNLTRKPLFYSLNLAIPCTLLSLIMLFVFLLPADGGEKVGLSITVLLSFSVFQLLLADTMPKSSDNVPLITIYVTFVMFLATLSLFCTIVVLLFHFHDSETEPPQWLKNLAFGTAARMLFCQYCQKKSDDPSEPNKKIDSEFNATLKESSLSNIVLEVTANHSNRNSSEANDYSNKINFNFPEVWICEKVLRENESESDAVITTFKPLKTNSRAKTRVEEQSDIVKEQWVKIGQFFDRLFFTIFLVATIISLFVVFGICPAFGNTFSDPAPVS